MLAPIAGCSTLSPDLRAAAATQGRASAGVSLPSYPARCAQPVPHAAVKVGDQAIIDLKRERAQLDRANGDKAACAGFYASLRDELGK